MLNISALPSVALVALLVLRVGATATSTPSKSSKSLSQSLEKSHAIRALEQLRNWKGVYSDRLSHYQELWEDARNPDTRYKYKVKMWEALDMEDYVLESLDGDAKSYDALLKYKRKLLIKGWKKVNLTAVEIAYEPQFKKLQYSINKTEHLLEEAVTSGNEVLQKKYKALLKQMEKTWNLMVDASEGDMEAMLKLHDKIVKENKVALRKYFARKKATRRKSSTKRKSSRVSSKASSDKQAEPHDGVEKRGEENILEMLD